MDDAPAIERPPVLAEPERRQLLVDWNATDGAYPSARCLHELFEQQVEATPHAVAVVHETRELSYRELNARANRLAHHLRELGVKPDGRVAICVERGIEMVVGLLAVLKAGGGYVPLDPAYPPDRLRYMLEDSAPTVVLAQGRLVELAGERPEPVPVLDLMAEAPAWAGQPDTNPQGAEVGLTSRHLAYVIYTSASTGLPKGVMVEHHSVVNLLADWLRRVEGFGEANDFATSLWTSFGFDVSVFELFVALAVGGAVHVVPERVRADPPALLDWFVRQRIRFAYLAPFFVRALPRHLAEKLSSLPFDFLLVGVEPLSEAELHQLRVARPGLTIVNGYGPTEATVFCTAYAEIGDRQRNTPIGRPIANTRAYILDAQAQPVPIGVTGEIHIGGAGVARGYLNRAQLTAERFIADPFVPDAGARMYRTGDLGRWLPDGNIEFLGRTDFQVKLRGYRIELGEIESRLLAHPGVGEAVVLARENSPGEKRLVAYYTSAEARGKSDGAEAEELRAHLAASLPEYMVPAAFVRLPALPLTPNGKLDRRALPVPAADVGAAGGYEEPPDGVERLLAGLWAEVLKVERIGRRDSFFALGGHSLLAIELTMRVRSDLGVEISVGELLRDPVLSAMAACVATAIESGNAAGARPLAAWPTVRPSLHDRFEPFPLTDVQQAYWIGRSEDFELGGVATHSYEELEVKHLDVDRYEQAWRRVIARHEMLRAVVLPDGRQQILESVPAFAIERLDLRQRSPEAVAAALGELRERKSHQMHRADRWPLFEIVAVGLSDERTRLCVSFDVLTLDAWSLEVLRREVDRFYDDPELVLAPLQLSFRDYVLAERGLRETDLYRESLEYWHRRLASLAPAPELPLAKSPAAVRQPRFRRLSGSLGADQWRVLKARAASIGVTPSVALFTAFAEILALWSRTARFTVNVTLFNRLPLHPEVNDAVGDFISLVLLEADLRGRASFEARAQAVQAQLWEDMDHRYVGGVQVLRDLTQMRGGAPRAMMPIVFTSLLVHGEGERARGAQEAPGISRSFARQFSVSQTPQVSLDHQVEERDGALLYHWDVVEELFPPGLLADMFATYERLAAALAGDEAWSEERGRVALPAHQLRMLAELRSEEDQPSAELVHTAFARRVEERPESPAIVTEDRTLTYRELHDYSNQVGRWLRDRAVEPNTLVAIVMEKGWEQVVASLGILVAGAAYLPIDASVPKRRLWYLLEQGEVDWVITQPELEHRLEWPAGVGVLALPPHGLEGVSTQPLTSAQTAADLAYVIFTSGSTGDPKGVMIDHGSAVNTVRDINERFAVTAADSVLALSALNFDLSVYDIFGMLAAGAAIVVPRADGTRDAAHWRDLMGRHRVTLWNTVPALMEMLVEHTAGRGERLPVDLRLVFLSGDWIPLTLPARIRALGRPGIELHSGGGATEAAIWSITYPIGDVSPAWRSIPYGKPMRNQYFRILDDDLGERPVWSAGHLHIGGAGLAKGYWKDAEKTARSFITHPDTGERLYRTGDRGCYLPSGTIEFLGREDTQVKVQGHRIELGEIEAALVQQPAVESCVVTAHGDPRGNKSLVAYVVTRDGEQLTRAEMQQHLSARLPSYMVPAELLELRALPLTANGKVDRTALPEPPRRSLGAAAEPRDEPQTPLHQGLISIWVEILGVEAIGPRDDFFALGGDSLMATRVVSRIRSVLGIDISIRALFENPTVAALAEVVVAQSARQEERRGPAIHPAARGDRLPLSFGQERLWFLDHLEPNSAAFNSAFAYHLEGDLDAELLEWSIGEVVRRHEVLRTTFETDDGEPVLQIAAAWGQRLARIDLRSLNESARGRRIAELAGEETRRPFDLVAGPLLRATLLHLGEQEHVFLLTAHHVAFDGWSLEIFLRDLMAAYKGGLAGQESPLVPLPLQYFDYGVWQRHWVEQEAVGRQLDYWRLALAGAPSALPLPFDSPRPPVQTSKGSSVKLDVPREVVDRLGQLGRQEGATDFIALLAAFNVLLQRYTSQDDIVVGTPIANRTRTEVEELIGLFVNPLALRTDLSGDPSFRELLRRVRERLLAAYAHQDLPFEKLVVDMQPERDLSRTPIFQVMFIMQNEPACALELPGLSIRERALEVFTCQFDLVLDVRVAGGVLEGRIEYNSDLFRRDSIERLAANFATLLADVCENPGKRLSELQVLTAVEEHTVLRAWNATAADYPRDSCFHELFSQQVARGPDEIAAVCGAERLTYAELERQVNRIAGHLAAAGVGADGIVALLAERSLRFLASMLGVFRAGGAYLPLDPAHPSSRYAQLLGESRAPIVLVERAFAGRIAEAIGGPGGGARPQVLVIEDLLAADSAPKDIAGGKATDLAYVIYTSGSTGSPKGVMVEQRGMLNHLYAKVRDLGLTAHSRVAQTASQCFDISVWQFLAPLLVGGQVHVYPDDVAHDLSRLLERVDRDGISVLESVPSMMQVMLAEVAARPPLQRPRLASLRWLVPTGEALPPGLCRQWFAAYPHVPLLNAYGPTECSDDVTHHPVQEAPHEATVHMPIGVPVQNTQIYVLNADLLPVPIGATGELFVGGDGVGRGYLGRADLTARQFVADPFRGNGARLYRTGDYGRHLPTGAIEYLGRRDQQVKLRGFRIELGEIEWVLRQHPAVAEAALVARDRAADMGLDDEVGTGSSGDLWLVAYVVCRVSSAPAAPSAPDEEELVAYLKSRLPDYMVPSHLLKLEAMPLTSNGKVDRRALPAPDVAPAVAPRKVAAGECFFAPHWLPSPLPAAERQPASETTAGSWLILGDSGALTDALVDLVRSGGRRALEVREGKRFSERGDVFTVRPQSSEDQLALVAALRGRGRLPDVVLHLWNVAPIGRKALEDPDKALRHSVDGLGSLGAALQECARDRAVELMVVSCGLQRVDEGDSVQPEKAPLLGLGRVLQQEVEGLRFRSVDVEPPGADPSAAAQVARQIVGEIESGGRQSLVAYRRGQRYVQVFESRAVAAPPADLHAAAAEAVYLIVDEGEGLGASLAVDLARAVQARIVLVSPVPLPEPTARAGYLASHPHDDPGSLLIQAVQELEGLGLPGLTMRADVTSSAQLRAAVQATLRRFGSIEGVVYAAGSGPGSAPVAEGAQSLKRGLGASLRGVRAVGDAIAGVSIGRLWLCAPLSALVGGTGRGTRCAGGAYLSALAESRVGASGPATTAVILDPEGLARETATGSSAGGRSPWEEALSHLRAGAGAPTIAITARPLPALLAESARFGYSLDPAARESNGSVAEVQSATEATIASMWQELLGVQRVCRTDSFFRVGGHSLAALQLVSRLREEFKVDLPVRASFEAPTLEELARRIDEARAEGEARAMAPRERVITAPSASEDSPGNDPRDEELGAPVTGDRLWGRVKAALRAPARASRRSSPATRRAE
jgi:amino acid adenylation domain-containing protein